MKMMNDRSYPLDITASGGEGGDGSVSIRGIAYSGGDILQWRGNMVVDLAGMEFSQQIPLLNSHYNSVEDKLGEVSASVQDGKLTVEGRITSQSDLAKKIVADGKKSNWQLSIGATIKKMRFIGGDDKATVNGVDFQGPLYVVEASLLREVSVVAVGADKGASMEITASLDLIGQNGLFFSDSSTQEEGEKKMAENEKKKDEGIKAGLDTGAPEPTKINAGAPSEPDISKQVDDAVKAALERDRKRYSDIVAAFNGDYPEIQAQAISEGWDMAKVNATLLKKIREDRPVITAQHGQSQPDTDKSQLECALCMRLGMSQDELLANKSFDEKTIEAAGKISDISLKDVVRECIRLNGGNVSRLGFGESDIAAGFSTVTLPGIMSNVANKAMMRSYNAVSQVARQLCTIGSLNDFKPTNRYRMTDLGDLEPFAAEGEFKHGEVTEEHASNQLETFGKMFTLTRKMIINDDMNAFTKVPTMMGAKAGRLIDKLFFQRLLANPAQEDGHQLFSKEHANILSTGGAFSIEALEKALVMFKKQTDIAGEPIAVRPKFLLVPIELEMTAEKLFTSPQLVFTGSKEASYAPANILVKNKLEIVSSPYLKSPTEWYIFANPAEIDTFEIGFLNGKQTPTIQRANTDFNTLGIQYRIFFDIGVREQDFRGVFKSEGK